MWAIYCLRATEKHESQLERLRHCLEWWCFLPMFAFAMDMNLTLGNAVWRLRRSYVTERCKRNSTPGQHQKGSFPAQYTSFVVKFSCRLLAPLLQQSEWPAQWANFPAEACTIAFPGSQKLWDNLVDIFAGPGNQLPGILTPKWEFSVLQNSTHTTVFNSQPSTSHSKQWKFFLCPPFSGEENGIG